MLHRHHVSAALVFASVAAWSGSALVAPRTLDASEPAVSLRAVTVTFAVEAHDRRGEMAAYRASMSKRFQVGDEMEGTLGTGSLKRPDICHVQVPASTSAYLRWSVKVRVRSADTERVEIDLAWSRTTGGTETVDEGTRTIVVPVGGSHLVDIVPARSDEKTNCSHVGVRLGTSRVALEADGLLLHRLWLVHEQGGARTVSDPFEAIGAAGESVPFRFKPLRWNLAGVPVTRGNETNIELDVLGTVTSEPREDGVIETTLHVTRQAGVGATRFGGAGNLVMAARMGESGEIQLPKAGGQGTLRTISIPDGPLAAGFSRGEGELRFNLEDFFRESRTSLVLTVERLR
jgi:hypothetical protein